MVSVGGKAVSSVSNPVCHAMHDISVLKPTGKDGNLVSQAQGHTYTVICVDTKMLLLWGALQKLPSKRLYIHSIHTCPLDMSNTSRGSSEVNRKPSAYYGWLLMIIFGECLSWITAWWHMTPLRHCFSVPRTCKAAVHICSYFGCITRWCSVESLVLTLMYFMLTSCCPTYPRWHQAPLWYT